MSRELEQQALQIFERALGLPDSEVTQFVEQSCGSGNELRRKVEALIVNNRDSTDLFPALDTDREASLPRSGRTPLLATGTLLNSRYEVIGHIGSGGMGVVYRARDIRLARDVAIKTLNFDCPQPADMQLRFDREMRSVASLSHPNIVTLFDVGVDSGSAYAVMEFVSGQTLRERITTKLSWSDAVRFTRDVALGLAAAHHVNMMHRDIKPENIVIDVAGHAKILDFGLARPEVTADDQNITLGKGTPGTAPYMSPEQAESRGLSCATDIFSLGIVLYESLSGFNPFRAHTLLKTLQNVVQAKPADVRSQCPDVPEDVALIVNDMLAPTAAIRPSAANAADRLNAILNTSGPSIARSAVTPVAPNTRSSSGQPSLIVVPFQAFGEDSELEAVANGLVENLTTVLTRIPLLTLVPRTSRFTQGDQPPSVSELRQRFGVDYVIDGSLQRLGPLVRANVQLIETRHDNQLWAQQFDCSANGTIVTNLLHNVLSRLEPQLVRAISDAVRGEKGELSSRQLLLQSMSVLSLKGWHVDSFNEVAGLLRQAIALDPDFALAHAYFALIRGLAKRVGLVLDPETAVQEAQSHAERAMDLEEMDSNVLGLAGCALSDVGQTSRAIPILRNAIDINPNNAQAHAALGAAHLAIGEWRDAIQHLQAGITRSPLDARLAVWYAMLATAFLQLGQSDEALAASEKGCQANRKTYMPRVVLTAVHLLRGDTEKAATALRESLRVKPDLSQTEITSLLGQDLGVAVQNLRSESI